MLIFGINHSFPLGILRSGVNVVVVVLSRFDWPGPHGSQIVVVTRSYKIIKIFVLPCKKKGSGSMPFGSILALRGKIVLSPQRGAHFWMTTKSLIL